MAASRAAARGRVRFISRQRASHPFAARLGASALAAARSRRAARDRGGRVDGCARGGVGIHGRGTCEAAALELRGPRCTSVSPRRSDEPPPGPVCNPRCARRTSTRPRANRVAITIRAASGVFGFECSIRWSTSIRNGPGAPRGPAACGGSSSRGRRAPPRSSSRPSPGAAGSRRTGARSISPLLERTRARRFTCARTWTWRSRLLAVQHHVEAHHAALQLADVLDVQRAAARARVDLGAQPADVPVGQVHVLGPPDQNQNGRSLVLHGSPAQCSRQRRRCGRCYPAWSID